MNVLLGGRIDRGPASHGADRYDYPEYRTRKALLEAIEYDNQEAGL
ncbi:MAG: hypothetical protein ACWGQW_01925 [bacterium]